MNYLPGDIVIAPFSYTDLTQGKNRPVLLISPLPNYEGDWLCCMITSQMHQFTEGIDVKIIPDDLDFGSTSLKTQSVFRVTRLMVISEDILTGKIGNISKTRFENIVGNLIHWLSEKK